jgi:hypothetical protein
MGKSPRIGMDEKEWGGSAGRQPAGLFVAAQYGD